MRAELTNLNHCAVPFLSRAAVNFCWFYYIVNIIFWFEVVIYHFSADANFANLDFTSARMSLDRSSSLSFKTVSVSYMLFLRGFLQPLYLIRCQPHFLHSVVWEWYSPYKVLEPPLNTVFTNTLCVT